MQSCSDAQERVHSVLAVFFDSDACTSPAPVEPDQLAALALVMVKNGKSCT